MADPALMSAVSIDIIVPLFFGICSRVKQLADEATMPKNQLAASTSAIEIPMFVAKTYDTVKIPDRRVVKAVEGFLPNLFMNLLALRLPKT